MKILSNNNSKQIVQFYKESKINLSEELKSKHDLENIISLWKLIEAELKNILVLLAFLFFQFNRQLLMD